MLSGSARLAALESYRTSVYSKYTHWLDGGFPTELVTVNPDGSGENTVVGGDFFQNWADWGTHS